MDGDNQEDGIRRTPDRLSQVSANLWYNSRYVDRNLLAGRTQISLPWGKQIAAMKCTDSSKP